MRLFDWIRSRVRRRLWPADRHPISAAHMGMRPRMKMVFVTAPDGYAVNGALRRIRPVRLGSCGWETYDPWIAFLQEQASSTH